MVSSSTGKMKGFFVVAGDGEYFREDGLQTGLGPLGRRNVLLQKVFVGFALNLNEVGRLNNFFDVSEVPAISHSFSLGCWDWRLTSRSA